MDNGRQADVKALLALCQADLCGQAEVTIQSVSNAAWPSVLACASNHGLTGLLYRTVANSANISPTTLLPIRSAAHAQAARCCHLSSELLEILTAFRELDIKALTLKGPTLALRAYGQISAREFCDLDILIHRADLERASLVLEQRGYRTDPESLTIEEIANEKNQYHAIFVREDDGAVVELHWALNSDWERAPIEGTGVWSRVQSVVLWNQPVLTLGIEDTLLYLCVHGFKHRWARLKWLTDIAYLLRSGEQVDWDALILHSRRIGCYRMLLVGLSLASRLLGSVIPTAIAKQARTNPVTSSLVEQISSALLNDVLIDEAGMMLYDLRAREGFRDHIVLSWRLLSRICRLTAEDRLPDDHTARARLAVVFKRLARLYRTYGLAWVKPVFRFR